jgi:hypothetical protein
MTVAQLIAILKKFDQSLPVAYACAENNLEGRLSVEYAAVRPADFGKLVLLTSS